MTDQRPPEMSAEEHDEYHSALEVDDTSGWRVFIVPIILLVIVIGMIGFFFLYQGDVEPDPRVAERLKQKEAEAAQTVQPAQVPALEPEAIAPAEQGPEAEEEPAPPTN